MTKLETIERLREDAMSLHSTVTFRAGRTAICAVYERGGVLFTIDGWPTDIDHARQALAAIQSGQPWRFA